MEDDVVIPDGLLDTNDALSSMHIISNMIGSDRNRNVRDIIKKLRALGFSDETSFYLLWYVVCTLYSELENVTNTSMSLLEEMDPDALNRVLTGMEWSYLSDSAYSDAVRMLYLIEEDAPFGALKTSWREHFRSRYNKYWRVFLNEHPKSVPYYSGEELC